MSLTPTTTRSIRRRAQAARRGSAVIAVAAIGIAATAGTAYGAFSRTRTSAVNTLTAASMGKGAKPTATVNGESVTIFWAAAKYSDNTDIAQYTVRRYPDGGTAETIICASPITALTCADSPGAGNWRYTVTPVHGAWTGPVSDPSAVVPVAPVITDTTPPTAFSILSAPAGANPDGKPGNGDKIIYTFSERMKASSILDGWDERETRTVTVKFTNNGNSGDSLTILSVNLGTLDLGKEHLKDASSSVTVTASMTMTTSQGRSIVTVTLDGAPNPAFDTVNGNTTWKWTPSSAATDLVGNAAGTNSVQQAGPTKNF